MMILANRILKARVAGGNKPPQGSSTNSSMVTASEEPYSPGSKAFDGVVLNGASLDSWIAEEGAANPTNPAWLRWDFGYPVLVSRFRYSSRNSTYWVSFKEYEIEVSNTGDFTGEQTLVHTGIGPNIPMNTLSGWYDLDDPHPAQYLRFLFKGSYVSGYVMIQEVEFE